MSHHPSAARGFTLIELLVVVVVLGVLSSLAFPSFIQTWVRFRLDGVVNELGTDAQYTRAEALRRREPTSLTVDAAGANYTITANTTNTVLKTVSMPSGITLTPNAVVSFDNLRGATTNVSIIGQATAYTAKLQVDINVLGRSKVCAPASGGLGGYAPC